MKKYSENGLWIKQDGAEYVIGLSPKGQDDLGDVSFVELLKSESVTPDDSIISVEAAKAVTELLAPLSGTVVAFHDELEENPEFLNELEEEKKKLESLQRIARYLSAEEREVLFSGNGFVRVPKEEAERMKIDAYLNT